MYSKIVLGLAMTGVATAADIVRRDTGGGHHGGGHGGGHHGGGGGIDHHSSGGSGSGYSEPHGGGSSGYGAPSTGYSGSGSGHGHSGSGHGHSGSGHGPYDVSGSGYGYYDDFPLAVIIIPILIIAGLSLLFPTITTVAVRKRRDAEESHDGSLMSDALERVNDIYMSVVESEECMERIACEIGGLSQDFGFKATSLAKMADPFVPAKYNAYYKQFKSGQNCHKIKCGSFSY